MTGKTYEEGRTFRAPRLSVLRAEYAAALRDQGLSYAAIATALGLKGKRRRSFQIVQHGRKLRAEAALAQRSDERLSDNPRTQDYYGPLRAALTAHEQQQAVRA